MFKNLENKKRGLARTCFRGGFTLVEMMVAIAVFSIVMTVAMSALLNVIDANNKARSIKTAINNISFALEGISKDMRMGTDYACGNDNEPNGDCLNGGNIISYISSRANFFEKKAYYKFNVNQIWECLEKGTIDCTFTGPWNPITSTEVKIDANKSKFYIIGTENSSTQPRMIMTISGKAGSKAKIETSFDLQTGVSQRIRSETL